MNSTPDPKRDKLDRLLDESLARIPEREAPASLLPNIMRRVAEVEQSARLSLFAKLQWPVVGVGFAFVIFITYYGKSLFDTLLGQVDTQQFAGQIEGISSGIQILGTIGNALGKVLGLIPSPVAVGLAVGLFFFLAVSCAGMGTALIKVTRPNYRPTH